MAMPADAHDEDLSKVRAVSICKKLLFKSSKTKSFMLLRPTNVRAVSAGGKVYVALDPHDPEHDDECDAKSAKTCMIIGSCTFEKNVKLTVKAAAEHFHMHLTNEATVIKMIADKGSLIGWQFEHLELLETPLWIVGAPRKDRLFVLLCLYNCFIFASKHKIQI